MFERFHGIMVLVFEYISLETSITKRSGATRSDAERRGAVITSSVYSYSLLFRFALSHASPVHSYGGYAPPPSLFTFFYTHTLTLPFIVSEFHRWTEMTHITLFRFYFTSLYTIIHTLTYYYLKTSLYYIWWRASSLTLHTFFNFHTFFMICLFSIFSNKIETVFSLSYIYHRSCL